MGRPKGVRRCKICGSTMQVSTHRLCLQCQILRQQEWQRQMKAHAGPYFERWLACVERARALGHFGRRRRGSAGEG